MRVAAIDCGTNSIRLLVADVEPGAGAVIDVERRMEVVRLGEGIDRTGLISDAALARTLAACDDYAAVIAATRATAVRFVATSASRDARNRDAFVAGVRARIGVEPEVVSGAVEATLSFAGATGGLRGAELPYLVVDIGGGSTEFVLGTTGPQAAHSVDVGCVRMTERHLHDDPPTPQQLRTAQADIDAAIGEAGAVVPFDQARTLVGLAGSVTTVAALALGLPQYDPTAIHGSRIPADQVRTVTAQLLAMTRSQRAALPVMHPGRVDVIGAGSLVLQRILELTGLPEVLVSERDILDGIALSLVPG
ncbi:MAG: Ppx/GppA family phosphatase [Actinomycetota bacterium]|nr:MAG: Ppx/GppA family phosphatase [Actinomycetota bacterium]